MAEWDTIASYYDFYFGDRTLDIEFWVSEAGRFGSPVLEFASGTGRLTIPMARAGVAVTGLDISGQMLRVARKKLAKEQKSTQKLVRLIRGDATKFSISGRSFRAIFSPWGFPAVTEEEEDSLFNSIACHLAPDGRFIVDIYNFLEPDSDWKNFGVQDFKKIPEKKVTIVRQVLTYGSVKTKINHLLFLWDIVKPDGTMKRIITERTEKIYTKRDMEHLITQHGFAIDEEYGNYDRTSWSSRSPRTIIIARKK